MKLSDTFLITACNNDPLLIHQINILFYKLGYLIYNCFCRCLGYVHCHGNTFFLFILLLLTLPSG